MKAYISVSYKNRQSLEAVINAITTTLKALNITPLVFVDEYSFTAENENQMMLQALADIDACDFLIAETSYKAIGIGVEAGYAKAKGKPIIYLRHAGAAHSTTVSGVSNHHIIYSDAADLEKQLTAAISKCICN